MFSKNFVQAQKAYTNELLFQHTYSLTIYYSTFGFIFIYPRVFCNIYAIELTMNALWFFSLKHTIQFKWYVH